MKKVVKMLAALAVGASMLLASGCYFWPDSSFDKLDPPAVAAPSPVPYETHVVQRGTMYIVRSLTGNFDYASKEDYNLVSYPDGAYYKDAPGYATVYAKQGDTVKKGTVLAQLNTDKLNAYIQQCKNEYRSLLQEYQAYRDSGNTAMAEELKKDVDAKKTEYEKAEADLPLYTITAPYDCIISELAGGGQENRGRYTTMSIYDPTSFALVNRSQANTMKFIVGDTGSIKYMDSQTAADIIVKGKITEIPTTSSNIDLNSRFVAVFDEDVDSSGIKKGTPGTYFMVDEVKEDVLMVPAEAIINFGNGKTIVRVLDEQGSTKGEKDVELGILSEGMYEVLDGLSEGDIVILNDGG